MPDSGTSAREPCPFCARSLTRLGLGQHILWCAKNPESELVKRGLPEEEREFIIAAYAEYNTTIIVTELYNEKYRQDEPKRGAQWIARYAETLGVKVPRGRQSWQARQPKRKLVDGEPQSKYMREFKKIASINKTKRQLEKLWARVRFEDYTEQEIYRMDPKDSMKIFGYPGRPDRVSLRGAAEICTE